MKKFVSKLISKITVSTLLIIEGAVTYNIVLAKYEIISLALCKNTIIAPIPSQ